MVETPTEEQTALVDACVAAGINLWGGASVLARAQAATGLLEALQEICFRASDGAPSKPSVARLARIARKAIADYEKVMG